MPQERTLVSFDRAIKNLLRNKADYVVLEGFLTTLPGKKIKIKSLPDSESNKDSEEAKYNRVDVLAEEDGTVIMIENQFHPQTRRKIMNRTKPILVAAISIAMTLTFSCSDGNGGDSSSGDTFTESLAIKEINDNSFTYVSYEEYDCRSNGTLEKYEGIREAAYSINNGVLTIKWRERSDAPEFNFNGNSSSLIGTWTRSKNKAAHCYEDDYYNDYGCHYGYDFTKAVFTQNKVSITRDFCWTDEEEDGKVNSIGWATKVIDCNTVEQKKGNDVVKLNIKFSNNSMKWTATYNGKSCEASRSEPSVSDMEKACKEAVEKGGHDYDEYYWDLLYGDSWEKFETCMIDKGFPKDLFGDSDDDESYEGAAMLGKKMRR
ncbi:MAG: hypothetical protein LBU89_13605 [Fibromonadaceae bacterium]|jgi:hypothetical protein|nr:hypothetical protein [Fibromonadaceae bacterium]